MNVVSERCQILVSTLAIRGTFVFVYEDQCRIIDEGAVAVARIKKQPAAALDKKPCAGLVIDVAHGLGFGGDSLGAAPLLDRGCRLELAPYRSVVLDVAQRRRFTSLQREAE